MGQFFTDNIKHTLRENILLDTSYLNEIQELPWNADVLQVCLKEKVMDIFTKEILRKINIANIKSEYFITEK